VSRLSLMSVLCLMRMLLPCTTLRTNLAALCLSLATAAAGASTARAAGPVPAVSAVASLH
jgi:hypothetical protein